MPLLLRPFPRIVLVMTESGETGIIEEPMSDHFIEKCRRCDGTISQCRCFDKNKEVRYSICENCKKEIANEEKANSENRS